MKSTIIAVIAALSMGYVLPFYIGYTLAQQPSDPIYWCNISRAQVSQERDASLAQIEALKVRNTALEARVKELETAKPKE